MEDTGSATPNPATTNVVDTTPTTSDSGVAIADWSAETIEADTGIALDGDGLPVNFRLRAERLARDGKDSDPGGMIEDSLIADTSARLAAIAEAYPTVRANMKTADLEAIAKDEGVDLSSASNNGDRVDLITASRQAAGVTLEESR